MTATQGTPTRDSATPDTTTPAPPPRTRPDVGRPGDAATGEPARSRSQETGPAVGRDLPSLTGLRAAAALAVFAFHSTVYGRAVSPWWHLADPGFVGVSFFFLLSGVVLTWSAPPRQRAATFARNRFARIVPAHVVLTIVAAVLYSLWVPAREPVWGLLLSLFLLQAWVPSVVILEVGNGVAWSLSCEAFFYALFPWLHPRLRAAGPGARMRIACAAAALGVLVALGGSLLLGGRYDLATYENPLARLGEFVIGMVLGLTLRDGWRPRLRPTGAWALLAAGWTISLALGHSRGWPLLRGVTDALLLGPFVLLLCSYAGSDTRGRRSWFAHPAVVYAGRVSFCFYLVHQVALGSVVRLLAVPTPTVRHDLLVTGVGLALAVVGAVALHHTVEIPAQRLLRAGRAPRGVRAVRSRS